MNQYHDLVKGILDHGIIRDDRTGVGTRSVFGRQLRFDLRALRSLTEGYLDCHLYQRSSDVFLGLPFNIASYALLTHMVAHVCGLNAGDLIISIGDAHLYRNHEEQAQLLLTRDHLAAPTLRLNPDLWRSQIDRFTAEDISLEGYQHHPAISAPVAV